MLLPGHTPTQLETDAGYGWVTGDPDAEWIWFTTDKKCRWRREMEQLWMWLDVDKGKHIHVGSPSVTEAAEVPQGEMELRREECVLTFLDQPETQEIQAAPGGIASLWVICSALSSANPTPGFQMCCAYCHPCLCPLCCEYS